MTFKAFDRTVSFAPGSADTKWIEAELAKFARAALAEAQRSGEASPVYTKAVNGRLNTPEESVTAPGPIRYDFIWLRDAAIYAREFLRAAAPKRSGRYSRSFIVVADGREVQPEAIGAERMVEVVNVQPYSRKIQVGARGFETHRGLFDAAARRLRSQFRGVVKVRVKFVSLSGAYRLKAGQGRRRDRQRGSEISYPALELLSETTVVN